MKEIRPWYRWWWHSYRTSERVLSFRSLAVHGAYQNLIAAAWELGGSLPNDRSILWRLALAGSLDEYSQVADQVEAMFTVSEDGKRLNNETLQNEWDNSTAFLNQRREAGKKSGEARREHPLNTRSTPVEHNANEPRTSSSSSSSSSSSISKNHKGGNVKAKDVIPKICRQILKTPAEKNYQDKQPPWSKIKELEQDNGGSAVVDAFTRWAHDNQSNEIKAPVSAFLAVVDDYLSGDVPSAKIAAASEAVFRGTEEFDNLCKRLYSVGKQPFNSKLQSIIKDLLGRFSAEDIFQAWNSYAGGLDDVEIKYAPKKFCESAVQMILDRQDEAAKQAAQTALISEIEKREQYKAEAENVVEEEIEEPL